MGPEIALFPSESLKGDLCIRGRRLPVRLDEGIGTRPGEARGRGSETILRNCLPMLPHWVTVRKTIPLAQSGSGRSMIVIGYQIHEEWMTG